MARTTKKRARPKPKPTFNPKDARPKPVPGFVCVLLGLLIFVSLFDYAPEQDFLNRTDAREDNLVGAFGVHTAHWTLLIFGAAAWLLPVFFFWGSYMYFLSQGHKMNFRKLLGAVACLGAVASFGTVLQQKGIIAEIDPNVFSDGLGGILGSLIFGYALSNTLGTFGSNLVLLVLFLIGLWVMLGDNLASGISPRKKYEAWKEARKRRAEEKKAAAEAAEAARQKDAEKSAEEPAKAEPPKPPKIPGRKAGPPPGVKLASQASSAPPPTPASKPGGEDDVEPDIGGDIDLPAMKPKPQKEETLSARAEGSRAPMIIEGEEVEKASVPLPTKRGDYVFPKMELLDESAPAGAASTEDYQARAELLEKTLSEFGVEVTMGEIHKGPVITRYDVYPARGVRVEKIINLDKNIALGLKATSVRILAPVPGKGCVGIEVPNDVASPVGIREILESRAWRESKAEIPIALGREVSGKPLIADLTRMPHLLIAGATGAGKTVCINSVITSLLYHSGPEELRFVMVDPKIVEMQVFNDLPHMLIPVVTDPKKVPGALKYLLKVMEERYQVFAQAGVRNIAGFNAKVSKEDAVASEKEIDMSPEERAAVSAIEVARDADVDLPKEKLPYIVCIIDELADLMMVAPADIETCVARLAQLARAAGIHLIIATQRPSVNVITGVIKANLPSRIAFKVASKVDSRTILDTMGADHLIGRGDMLFLPPGSAELVRSQGAFVSDDEIKHIVDFLKERNGEADIDEQFHQTVESGEDPLAGGDEPDEGTDELIPDAIEVLRATKRASTSMLQRRLKIGYNRAARIMEELEERGIVGPENGAQPREILKDLDSF